MKSEEKLVTLTELGLTNNQARTYLALLQAGPMTATELSKISKIDRPDIYRIVPALQKEGLVEKLITRPASFEAIPPMYVLPLLLKQKTTKQYELKRKTQALLSDLKNNHTKKEFEEANTEFIIVPKKEAMIQRLRESLLNAQTSACAVTSSKRFSAGLLAFGKAYQKALDNGVKIRIATDYHVAGIEALKVMKTLSRNPDFQVRYLAAPLPTIMATYDDKEAIVALSPTGQLGGTPAIWSNNRSFIVLAQNYFENKWSNSMQSYSPEALIA